MPPLPFLEGLMQVQIEWYNNATNWRNRFYAYRSDPGPYTATQLETVASAVTDLISTNVLPRMSENYGCSQVICIDLSNDDGTTGQHTLSEPGGGASGMPQSPSASLCIVEKIPRRYRGGHPRMYIAGYDASFLNAGYRVWSNTFINDVEGDWTPVFTAFNALSVAEGDVLTWCGVSYYTDKALRETPLATAVSGLEFQPRLCSQRKRLGKSSPDDL
jgi:hypothetical protein